MKKVMLILLAAVLLSGGLLTLISLPVATTEVKLPFTLDDGSTGVMKIVLPKYLRLGDPSELNFTIVFDGNKSGSSATSAKIKADLQTTQLAVEPESEYTAVLAGDGTGYFTWKMTTHNAGKVQATLWCFRISAAGPELILSRNIELNVKSVLEMRYSFARWILGEIVALCILIAGFTWFRLRKM